jgi:hypothetical protein
MMKNNRFTNTVFLAGVFVIIFLGVSTLFIQGSKAEEKVWEDERLGLTLDKLERANKMPDSIPSYLKAQPKQGNDYAIIKLTVSRLKGVYLISADSLLIDTENREYKKTLKAYTGRKLRDKSVVNSGLCFVRGATFTFFYELPIKAKPSKLKLNYSYLKSLEDRTEKKGQIEIKIPTRKK